MPTKKTQIGGIEKWTALVADIKRATPSVLAFLLDPNEFTEVRFKVRDDGTVLAIAKGLDSSGGPVVCFGVGYDFVLALMALDASIQGDNWRVDKPWKPGK